MCTEAWCCHQKEAFPRLPIGTGEMQGGWKVGGKNKELSYPNWACRATCPILPPPRCPSPAYPGVLYHEPWDVAVTRALSCSTTAPWPQLHFCKCSARAASSLFQCSDILNHTSGERGNCQPSKLLFGLLFVPLWELNFRSYQGKGWHDQVKTPHPRGCCRGTIYINKLIPCSWGRNTEQLLLLQKTVDFWWSSVEKKTYFIPK